jgi:hypothetical protein
MVSPEAAWVISVRSWPDAPLSPKSVTVNVAADPGLVEAGSMARKTEQEMVNRSNLERILETPPR